MHLFSILAAVGLFAVASTSSGARAQVTTNDQALDALKPAKPVTGAPAAPVAPEVAPPAHHTIHHPARPARPVKPTLPPSVPAAPPVNPVMLPPTFVMPTHPRPNPPPVPIKVDAPGVTAPITGGSRITFGQGSASLNQATHDAIMAIALQAKTNPALQISVTAWAPGTADDPSTPRTLALERALAARAVLINAGIVSDRILAVSKGFDGIEAGPPDRLDITVAAPKQTPAGTPAPAPARASAATKPGVRRGAAPAHAIAQPVGPR